MNADDPSGTRAGADPAALRRIPFALFAFFAVPLLLAHSRRMEGQNGASRGVPAPAEFRVGCGAVQRRRAAGLGAGCDGKGPVGGRGRAFFAKLRNDPPVGSDPGGATTPGKDQHRSRWVRFFAKLRNDPPAGAGSCRQVRPGRATTRGRTGAGRGGRGFCEIAQRPSRRGRLLSSGSARTGHDSGKNGHKSWRTWFLRNCATTLPPGQAPLAGFGPDGPRLGEERAQVVADVVFAKSRNDPPAGAGFCRRVRPGRATTRGRTGTGRGGRGFCEIAQRPSRRVRHGRGHDPGKDRHRSQRSWFFAKLRNDPPAGAGSCRARHGRGHDPAEGQTQVAADVVFAKLRNDPPAVGRLLPPGSARRGFCEMRNNPRIRCPEGVRDATVRHRPCVDYDRVGSLGPRTLTLVASRLDLSRKARER